jgi:hypothetical protein
MLHFRGPITTLVSRVRGNSEQAAVVSLIVFRAEIFQSQRPLIPFPLNLNYAAQPQPAFAIDPRECEVSHRTLAAPPSAFSSSVSFDPRRELINDCRPCLAYDFVLGIRASRTTDCADNHSLVDQWNTASRRNDSIEREQIVEVHKLDTVLEDLRWPPESHGCSRLVLRNLNGGEHRAVYSFEGN